MNKKLNIKKENVSEKVKSFDINLYINFIEDRNLLYQELKEIGDLLTQYPAWTFELCAKIKHMMENVLVRFQQKYDLNYCHVNMIALGFYRISIGPCKWYSEQEFLTINLKS